MNEAYTRQTGYTREEALGRPLQHLRHAMPDDPGMQHLRDAIAHGQATQMEIVSYRKDGSSFWNQVTLHPVRSATGDISHWITVERDVSEAVERESKLEDQHARLLLLTSAARRLFGALDYRALVARLEEAVRELVGGTAMVYKVVPDGRTIGGDALVARAARTRGHVTDESRFRAAVAAGTADHISHVLEVRAASGRTLRSGDLFVMDLLAEYFGVAVRNASLVRELEERRSAILELNQVKSDLIAMLAHDFKSPLTSIVGFTELAMDLGEVNADQREYLESVKRLALRLADLASDTLAFSRLERNEIDLLLAEVDLGAMATETADLFADQRGVKVSVNGDAIVLGDVNRLRQVLYNLVENAIKYSHEDRPVDVVVTGGHKRVRLQVVDRGIGIPGEELSSVFGRFSRASNARKLQIAGTGFGLYLARQIVELHGGAISVQSTEGQGSTFTVDLPRRGAPWHEAPLSIAVLERQRESRSFIAHALREAGLRVHIYHTVEDLIARLELEHVDRLVVDYEGMAVSGEQTAALETAQEHYGFTIVPVEKPFLVQDLLSAIRSRPE
jgi:PAS domain S-box-containing protein